ncbi:MAG: ATP-binding cassette domain-containing protein [Bdellovibrionota bacterium]
MTAQPGSHPPIAIEATKLGRVFRQRERTAGVGAALRAFFKPVWTVKDAVKSVDLQIPQGSVVGLVGANGAGKTTFLKMMSGLLHPSSGKIRVLGFTPHERDPAFLRRIGMVMGQKSQMWVDIPAYDTFMLLAAIYGIDADKAKMRVDELAKLFGITQQLGVQVRRLSLGERMKLEVMAALLHEPDLLILDEPTIGLDVLAKETLRSFIRDYNKTQKTTIILSSHDMEDISELCDSLLVIHKGELVFKGSLTDFTKDQALKSRVQEILGSS